MADELFPNRATELSGFGEPLAESEGMADETEVGGHPLALLFGKYRDEPSWAGLESAAELFDLERAVLSAAEEWGEADAKVQKLAGGRRVIEGEDEMREYHASKRGELRLRKALRSAVDALSRARRDGEGEQPSPERRGEGAEGEGCNA